MSSLASPVGSTQAGMGLTPAGMTAIEENSTLPLGVASTGMDPAETAQPDTVVVPRMSRLS